MLDECARFRGGPRRARQRTCVDLELAEDGVAAPRAVAGEAGALQARLAVRHLQRRAHIARRRSARGHRPSWGRGTARAAPAHHDGDALRPEARLGVLGVGRGGQRVPARQGVGGAVCVRSRVRVRGCERGHARRWPPGDASARGTSAHPHSRRGRRTCGPTWATWAGPRWCTARPRLRAGGAWGAEK